MESHEERLHKMIIQSKVNETKDVMKRKAMEIDKSKLSDAKLVLPAPCFTPGPARAHCTLSACICADLPLQGACSSGCGKLACLGTPHRFV